MLIEEQATLQIKFVNQLKALIKILIDFETIYSDVAKLPATDTIKVRANQKIENDKSLDKFPSTMYADTLRKYIEFVHVLIPDYQVERIPLHLDASTHSSLISKMLSLPIEKNTTRMYAKSPDDSDITCDDILNGTYTDLQIIERLNALGDLTNTAGTTRNKNESILYKLIQYLNLSEFAKETNPDVATVQFYFTLDIRVQMNNVLKEVIKYVSYLYNIASSVELQLRPVLALANGSNSQNALSIVSDELRRLYVEDLLQEKFAALRNQLEKIEVYESFNNIKDNNVVYIQVVGTALQSALIYCKEWQTNLPTRYPKLTLETDANMAKMIIILVNFSTQLNALKKMFEALTISTSEIFKTAEPLKSAIEEITKKQAADKARSNSPPRVSPGLFGGAINTAAAATTTQRPRPETSPHPTNRPPSAAPTGAAPELPQSAALKKSGSQIGRTTSNSSALIPSSSPQHTSIAPATSPTPGGNGKH